MLVIIPDPSTTRLSVLKRTRDRQKEAFFGHYDPGGLTPPQLEAWKMEHEALELLLRASELRFARAAELDVLLKKQTEERKQREAEEHAARVRERAQRIIEPSALPPPTEMLSVTEVCKFFGGEGRPLDKSTLYRWVRTGKFPRAIRIGANTTRWLRSDCEALLNDMRTNQSKGDK